MWKLEECIYQPDWTLQNCSPLSPVCTLMVKGFHEKSASYFSPWELRAPWGGRTNPATLNLNRLWVTDTGKSSAHQITSWESCLWARPPVQRQSISRSITASQRKIPTEQSVLQIVHIHNKRYTQDNYRTIKRNCLISPVITRKKILMEWRRRNISYYLPRSTKLNSTQYKQIKKWGGAATLDTSWKKV